MQIQDEQKAVEFLELVGFSRFLSYADFATLDDGTFVKNTNFYTVASVYRFDSNLRASVFTALEPIEIALRAIWIDAFTSQFGPLGYLNPHLFANPFQWEQHLAKLNGDWTKVTDISIKPYVAKYEAPPLWFAVHSMPLGNLSKWISNSPMSVQTILLDRFNLESKAELERVLKSLTSLRNCCAHHSKVWNNYFPIVFPDLSENKSKGGRKLYHAICLIEELLKRMDPHGSRSEKWSESINNLVRNLPAYQRKAMGYPKHH